MRMPTALADLLVRLNHWPRRLAALACLFLAALSAVAAGKQASARDHGPPASTPVVIAARDLGVGVTLVGHDLVIASWPRELVPAGASGRLDRLVGRRLAAPLRKREVVTTARLVGSDLTAGLSPGEVATAVSTDSGFASLIHAGDRVDVLAGPPEDGVPSASPPQSGTASGAAILVAGSVTVLAVLPSTSASDASNSAQVVLATDRDTALRIIALRGRQVLAVAASPPDPP